MPEKCHFKTAKCHNCHKIGRLKKTCTAGRLARDVRQVTEDSPPLSDSESSEYTLFILNSSSSKSIQVSAMIDKQQLLMEMDTGVAVLLLSEETYCHMWPQKSLQQATTVLRTYSGEQLKLNVCGCMTAEVVYGHQQLTLLLLVIKANGPSLLGEGLVITNSQLQLNWREINTLMGVRRDEILAQYKVFQEGLGTL